MVRDLGEPSITSAGIASSAYLNIGAAKIEDVGGKGYNLLELERRGFRVPRFFISPTSAFTRFLEENNTSIEHVGSHKAEMSEAIMKMRFPLGMESEIVATYRKLFDDEKVAVRSSATVEDMEKESMAGRFETVLAVSEDDVPDAIRRVYASLLSAESVPAGSKMAVVIQKQVDTDKSGVAFVDHDGVKINAVIGHGNRLVAGKEVGDIYMLDKGGKLVISVSTQGHVTWDGMQTEALPIDIGSRQKLSNSEINEIANVANQIFSAFRKPQDIEWCLNKEGLFLLQTRPLTKGPSESKQNSEISGMLHTLVRDKNRVLFGKAASMGNGIAEGTAFKGRPEYRAVKADFILVMENGSMENADDLAFRAKAIITRNGGAFSHLAIVARETEIPYVAGVDIDVINEGDSVRVEVDEDGVGKVIIS